jgi:xylose dehydrogenase (NAD/NADP)
MSDPPLRIGILGTANIARQFIAGVRPSSTVSVLAVGSRDPAKAAAFADETGIPRRYGSYAALLADHDIDAVYNPLPNSLHAEWSIRAMEAGKHVLCEKPIAVTAAEARTMFEAARRCGVHLVEGYPYRAQPQTLKLKELVDRGALGRVQLIQASMGFTMVSETNIRSSPLLGGGALMDVGVYPVSLARMLARERPAQVSAVAHWTGSGVDRTLAATIEFPSGLLAQVAGTFATSAYRQALIAGTEGVLQTTFMNHPNPVTPPVLYLKRGTGRDSTVETLETPTLNGFLAEAESFERLVRLGPDYWTGVTEPESIDIMLTVEALLQSARSGQPVRIDQSR